MKKLIVVALAAVMLSGCSVADRAAINKQLWTMTHYDEARQAQLQAANHKLMEQLATEECDELKKHGDLNCDRHMTWEESASFYHMTIPEWNDWVMEEQKKALQNSIRWVDCDKTHHWSQQIVCAGQDLGINIQIRD